LNLRVVFQDEKEVAFQDEKVVAFRDEREVVFQDAKEVAFQGVKEEDEREVVFQDVKVVVFQDMKVVVFRGAKVVVFQDVREVVFRGVKEVAFQDGKGVVLGVREGEVCLGDLEVASVLVGMVEGAELVVLDQLLGVLMAVVASLVLMVGLEWPYWKQVDCLVATMTWLNLLVQLVSLVLMVAWGQLVALDQVLVVLMAVVASLVLMVAVAALAEAEGNGYSVETGTLSILKVGVQTVERGAVVVGDGCVATKPLVVRV